MFQSENIFEIISELVFIESIKTERINSRNSDLCTYTRYILKKKKKRVNQRDIIMAVHNLIQFVYPIQYVLIIQNIVEETNNLLQKIFQCYKILKRFSFIIPESLFHY